MEQLLERLESEIPPGGEWSKADAEYNAAAKKLSEMGMSDDEIVRFLKSLYWAAAEEYGA